MRTGIISESNYAGLEWEALQCNLLQNVNAKPHVSYQTKEVWYFIFSHLPYTSDLCPIDTGCMEIIKDLCVVELYRFHAAGEGNKLMG